MRKICRLTTVALLSITLALSAQAADLDRIKNDNPPQATEPKSADSEPLEEWIEGVRPQKPVEIFTGFDTDEEAKEPEVSLPPLRLTVFTDVTCEGDQALEARIRLIAENNLRLLENIDIVGTLEEASVIVSYTGFRVPNQDDVQKEVIVYSFAYGTPEFEFVDSSLVSLPRYIYHEAVMTTREELSSAIDANFEVVGRNFWGLLY